MQTHQIGNNFSFSGVRLERLQASEYTLASIAVDITGSTAGFSKELNEMLEASILSLKKSPRAANMLVRVSAFNSMVGVQELHGFKPLSDIDVAVDYPAFRPDGATNLFDATYSLVGATADYGEQLSKSDYNCNGIGIVITDGMDNTSKMTPASIKDKVEKIRKDEKLESMLMLLVGIDDVGCQKDLDRFRQEAGFDQYIGMGDVTPQKLSKLAGFVSQSVSSTSVALGTGGVSQKIPATI
jgi:hypothetical protein